MVKSLAAVLLSTGLLASSVTAQEETCVSVNIGDNFLVNPSFEGGLTSDWNYWAPITELDTEDYTDGRQSLSFGGSTGNVIFQTITTFEIGKTYSFYADYKGYLIDGATPPSSPQHCYIIFELDTPYAHSIDFKDFTYTPGEETTWEHVSGEWVATVTQGSIAFYPSCQEATNDANTFNSGDFRFLMDNAIVKEQTQSCTTITSTSTTSSSTTSTSTTPPTSTLEPNTTPSNTLTTVGSTPINTPTNTGSTPSVTPTSTPVSTPSTTLTLSTETPSTMLSTSIHSSTPVSSPTTTSRGRCGQVTR